MKLFLKNILKWIYKYKALIITIGVFGLLVGLKLCNSPIICWIECKFGLDFYQIFVFVGAIVTLFWTDIRIKKVDRQHEQTLKQYRQTEDNAFLGKINTTYLKVVELLSDPEERKTTKAKNLINYIQANIDRYYKDISEEEIKEKRRELLNFSGMDLKKANLERADLRWADLRGADLQEANLRKSYLQGAWLREANLQGADLQEADLTGAYLLRANLQEANFFEANVKGTDFTGAKNINKAINLHTTKHLDQAMGIPKSIYSQLIEKRKAYRKEKKGHPEE